MQVEMAVDKEQLRSIALRKNGSFVRCVEMLRPLASVCRYIGQLSATLAD